MPSLLMAARTLLASCSKVNSGRLDADYLQPVPVVVRVEPSTNGSVRMQLMQV